MNFNFIITEGNKNKARKIRIHNEKKWLIPKIVMGILLIISAATFCTGITAALYSEFKKLAAAGIVFVISLVAALILFAVIKNLASHWIQDRLNERLKIDEYLLYHFVSFASGLNSRKADSSGCIFVFELYTITNVKYDEKSKRIEFTADGTGYSPAAPDRWLPSEWKRRPPGWLHRRTGPPAHGRHRSGRSPCSERRSTGPSRPTPWRS